jgi:hypothetical protein
MDAERIRKLDLELEPCRSEIGSARNDIKEIIKQARKDGIEPAGFKMAKRLENFKPTKRAAVLATFNLTLEALGIDAQKEMFEVIEGGKQAGEKTSKPSTRARLPAHEGKVRGKGGIGRREPKPAA